MSLKVCEKFKTNQPLGGTKLSKHMQVILNKHAKIYGDHTTDGAIIVKKAILMFKVTIFII